MGALAADAGLSAHQVTNQLESSFPELDRGALNDLIRQIMDILRCYVRTDGAERFWTHKDLADMRIDFEQLMGKLAEDDELLDWRLETTVEDDRAYIHVTVVQPLPFEGAHMGDAIANIECSRFNGEIT